MEEVGSEIELDENQRRNLKRIVNKERLLIETTPQLEQPLFIIEDRDGSF